MGYKDLLAPPGTPVSLDHAVGVPSTPDGRRHMSTSGRHIIYSGITGGMFYTTPGGGANYLCMPKNPEYSSDLTYRNNLGNECTFIQGNLHCKDHIIMCRVPCVHKTNRTHNPSQGQLSSYMDQRVLQLSHVR